MLVQGFHRYAAPVNEPVRLDGDGFLLPAGQIGAVQAERLAAESRSFALLAAGGAGKTTTAVALAKVEPGAVYVDTPLETRVELEKIISEAATANRPVYFDALDEAAAGDRVFMRWLGRQLGKPEAADGYWRLSCRAAAWDPSVATALPDFKTWKLLPLDRGTAEAVVGVAMGSSEFDGAAFIDAAAAAGLGRLSGCVSQLIAVARFWHGRGTLPQTAVQAIEYEVEHLLQETNSQRPRRFPVDRAIGIARRLAAFEAFSDTQAFAVAATEAPGALTVDRLPSESEPAAPARSIEPDDYRDVLDTALFDVGPAGAVVFRHQSYVEFLAAAYLVERKLQPGQVPALLGVHSNGLLPASRLGVAAWLGALKPELVERLIHANALMFASSATATELPSDSARATVVSALLEQAARGEIGPDWQVDPALLVHVNLEAALQQSLATLRQSEQLWWIARLAGVSKCAGLAGALLSAAGDMQWHAYARRAAVIAVGALGDHGDLASLKDVLEEDDDSDHEVRSAILDILYPRFMSTQEMVAALRPRSELIGSYRRTLDELADRIPLHDLPVALDWYAKIDDDEDGRRYGGLVDGLLRRAWEHADSDGIRHALARLLVSADWHLLSSARRGLPWNKGNADRRHNLILAMAGVKEEGWLSILMLSLLRSDDMEWLLDQVSTCQAPVAAPLAECLSRFQPDDVSAALADRILSLPSDHPAYKATQGWRGTTDLSTGVGQIRHQQAVAMHEADLAKIHHQEQAKIKLVAAIADVDGDPGSWWQIIALLSRSNKTDRIPLEDHDLTEWPGWAKLESDDAAKLIDAGLQYLDVHTPDPTTWLAQSTWTTGQIFPDWSGVYLLATLVRRYPHKLSDVKPDIWRRWMPAIVAVPVFSGEDSDGLRIRLLDAVPAEHRPLLADEAMNYIEVIHASGKHLTVDGVCPYLAQELASRIAHWLLTVPEARPAADDLLSFFVRSNSADTALDLCRRLRSKPNSPLVSRAEELLPTLDPDSAVDELTNTDGTPERVAAVASKISAASLDHDHVLAATQLLLNNFSFQDDPPFHGGTVTPEDRARSLRGDLLHQLASAGRVDDLSGLLVGREDVDRQVIGRFLATARARQADIAVKTVGPQVLLDLLRSADARLVRDDADFQTAIVLQLDDLQHQIAHTSAFREIWDGKVPQAEDSVTDWIQRRLTDRFAHGVVVDREVQVNRPKPQGIGTRIDCVATTITETKSTARVLFEAKLANNKEVPTAMDNQLIDRYLVPEGRRHGILLIYWIHPDSRPQHGWPKSLHPDKQILQATLQEQAEAAAKRGFHIVPVILDITPPEGFAGKGVSSSEPGAGR